MAAYTGALHHVTLAGPTLFGPVINKAAEISAQSLSFNNTKYYVLLIITVSGLHISITSIYVCLFIYV